MKEDASAREVRRNNMVLQWLIFQGVESGRIKMDRERHCYHTRCQIGMLRPSQCSLDTFCLGRMTNRVVGKEFVIWGTAVSTLAI